MKLKEMIIDGEQLFLKKSFTGWRIVHPIKVNGKIHLRNLIAGGSWYNLLKIAGIIAVILMFTSEYSNAVNIAQECLENPFVFKI